MTHTVDKVIISLIVVATIILFVSLSGCKTLNTAVEYGVGQIEEYKKQKDQCENNGWNWSGKIENPSTWECTITPIEPDPGPVIIEEPEEVIVPGPVIIVKDPVEPDPEPVIIEEPKCENTSTNYCGGSVGHTFKTSGRRVTFTVTGIEGMSPTRFIYWMEDSHGNWYNSILYGPRHRGMYNNTLIEHGGHDFDPSKEYTFIVAWGGGYIIQEIFENKKRICHIGHEAFLENIKWAKIGKDAHGETAFKILSARIE